MKRYLPSIRTSSNLIDTNALRDQFLRELSKEATSMLKELSDQFGKTLQAQASQTLSNAAGSGGGVSALGDGTLGLGSIGQLLTTGARYLLSKPHTSLSSAETARSVESTTQFRVSNAQAAAEAQIALGKGDKNL